MSAALPFTLKVPGTDEIRGVHAVSTSFSFHGFLRLEVPSLLIEWTGAARVQDVGALSVRDDRLPFPTETLVVPVARLHRAELIGGWWRPRLEISANDLGALAIVPSEDQGKVRFWYARRDRSIAEALATALTHAIAGATLAAQDSAALPREPGEGLSAE